MHKLYKQIGGGLLLALAGLVVAGCSFCFPLKTVAQGENIDGENGLTLEKQAEKLVSRMSDSQKIGQLLMIGIQGTTLDQDSRYMLSEFPNGNVILFDRNMKTPEQVQQLTAEIQNQVKAATGVPAFIGIQNQVKAATGVPAFIGVDQEGGQVRRMETYMPDMPAAAVLGKQSPDVTYRWAVETGKSLRQMGINVNFAPVVDLDGAYQRSYGKTPEEVIPFAKAAIEGYTETGVMTSLKHFPGIGKVKTDPHLDGDLVLLNRQELDQLDGKPFRTLIDEMDADKTFVMVSNVTFPNLGQNVPACLSKVIMTDILRKSYGYQGLILTDDMDMGAMAKHYPFSEMGVKAIEAGADIVLVCQDYGHVQQVFNGLLKAYRAGTIDQKMVDEKVRHIVMVKLKELGK